MKIKMLLTGLIISAFCVSAEAHRDRIIQLKGNKLIGLPEQYQPATFSATNLLLSIGKYEVKIPAPIWNRFGNIETNQLIFTSSWYHEEGTLPPYINIHNSNFSLLLNLDSLEIIEASWEPKIPEAHLKLWIPKEIPNQRMDPTSANAQSSSQ